MHTSVRITTAIASVDARTFRALAPINTSATATNTTTRPTNSTITTRITTATSTNFEFKHFYRNGGKKSYDFD